MPMSSDPASAKSSSPYYSIFDLRTARLNRSRKEPASHQHMALGKMHEWVRQIQGSSEAGGIVVLPTGAGKTFTAVRFLCSGPLSKGYKVVWLAHTHHLLEQAFDSFANRDEAQWAKEGVEIGHIAEPKALLALRVVSGTSDHFPVSEVKGDEDVLIITLQTLANAWERRADLKGLSRFFSAAGEKLVVVFDEAHHSPAPRYRNLIKELRGHHRQMLLVGLTATPTYTDERKRGWLKKLFPQEILFEVSARKLMAEGILAKPIFERTATHITPNFSQREFQKWVGTFRDLPEDVIDSLANNRERNALIAETYVKNRSKYGQTIIFAERWSQCEFLSELLQRRGVRTGAIYSHVDAVAGTVAQRNRRDKDENHRVLEEFRQGKLDVIINIRMLTEGTDVPKVNSVFITRDTTSQILATQMVGRALRGPKFGGTKEAYIVTFADDWQHKIPFADFRQLEGGGADDETSEHTKRPPLQLISIELVRQLSRQMDTGITVAPAPFLSMMPVGWYQVEFEVAIPGTDDVDMRHDLIMVFDDNHQAFEKWVVHLLKTDLALFATEMLDLDRATPLLMAWQAKFFANTVQRDPGETQRSLVDIARHIGQNQQAPVFFPFTERSAHDVDALVADLSQRRLPRDDEDDALLIEFQRKDRYWATLYLSWERFKSQYDACWNRIRSKGKVGALPVEVVIRDTPESLPDREPTEAVKLQVLRRDGFKCRCCGESQKRLLQVDHLASHPRSLAGQWRV
jgi:ATP-dependent helicase IRC3